MLIYDSENADRRFETMRDKGSFPCSVYSLILSFGTTVSFSICNTESILKRGYEGDESFFTKSDRALFECASLCKISKKCLSFSLDTATMTCSLHDNNTLTKWTNDEHVIFSDIRNWHEYGSNKNRSCDALFELDRFNVPICSEEVTCDLPPPELANGNVTYTGKSENDLARYTCDDGLVLVGASTARCGSSGTWEKSYTRCALYNPTWTNKTTPFRTAIPTEYQKYHDFTATINGFLISKPYSNNFFVVNFISQGMHICHISLRFGVDDLVYNTNYNGKNVAESWGKEIHTPLTMKTGQRFSMTINYNSSRYTVNITQDGASTFQVYPDRYPGMKVDNVGLHENAFVYNVSLLLLP